MGVFYKDKPVFGFDIGRSSIKIMQINQTSKKAQVVGYGTANFGRDSINEQGVVTNPETIIKSAHDLISNQMVGSLSTHRVAVSIPNANSFSRVLSLPKMDRKELEEAVRNEVDSSIPLPSDELYYDFSIARESEEGPGSGESRK